MRQYCENDQTLVDICFACVLTSHDKEFRRKFNKMTQEELANWVAKQLDLMGFPTKPCGSLWGVLQYDNRENK